MPPSHLFCRTPVCGPAFPRQRPGTFAIRVPAVRRVGCLLLAVALVLVLIIAGLWRPAPTLATDNLLSEDQSDFENATTGWEQLVNVRVHRTRRVAATGDTSLQIAAEPGDPRFGGWSGAAVVGTANSEEAVTATAGETYHGLLHVRPHRTPAPVRCELQFYDAKGRVLETVAGPFLEEVAGDWVAPACEGTAPNGATTVSLRLSIGAGQGRSVHYLDDAVLTVGHPPDAATASAESANPSASPEPSRMAPPSESGPDASEAYGPAAPRGTSKNPTSGTVGSTQRPRQQTNELTAFLDGSVVYGSDKDRADALRTFSGGKLKTSKGNMLPFNTDKLPNTNDAHIVPSEQLYLAGEPRANENIELTAIHALFVREHNLLAAVIAKEYPHFSDEQIFQRARRIVAAELQVITYKEFIPALLGDDALRPYTGYKPDVNPGIANEFSTAAFRIGHTLVNDDVEFFDNEGEEVREEVELAEAFFNPATLKEVGPDPILKYLATDNAQEVDLKLVDGLRNFLFGPPGAGGFDLASRNIQRGRDHGLADYNTVRQAYGLPTVTDFDHINKNAGIQKHLHSLYGNVDDIDLWVGGLAEEHVPGSSVGPTFRRIMVNQFERIRDGDRFWYQQTFSGEQLAALESTRLSDVIRRNTDITKIQDNVFFFDEATTLKGLSPKKGTLPDALIGERDSVMTQVPYDGRGNNQQHPQWGQAGNQLLRTAPAAYSDGMSAPAGHDRPNARLISNTLSAQSEEEKGEDAPRNRRDMSDWIYGWGQFIDHDLGLTNTGSTPLDIKVPTGDPLFDPNRTGTQVISLKRSNFGSPTDPTDTKTTKIPEQHYHPLGQDTSDERISEPHSDEPAAGPRRSPKRQRWTTDQPGPYRWRQD
jgi:hypothetical protein